ncbi:winged helix-turn-helix domain-containing protein [Dysosmobacter sp.]|uniref:winged helix-turn-helix domain-containing protein n=1 Tax=Dysosmobacter sp. TaxID=2591382 RepID=UPI003AB29A3E
MTYNNCYLNQLYNDLISNSPQTIALDILKNHPEIEKIEVDEEPMVSLPGLEIFPSRRKVFRDRQEIQLTAKEYRILLLLAANKGRVLTYVQIYEQVWGDFTTGNENNTIGFHICNLREKLYRANPDAPFYIRSVREVGYSLEVIAE